MTGVAILLEAGLADALGRADRIDAAHVRPGAIGRVAAFISVGAHLTRAKETITTCTNMTTNCILAIGIFVTFGGMDYVTTEH